MTTLTTTVSIYKKLIYWVIGAIVLLIVGLLLFRIGILLKNRIAPAPPAPASVAFGQLPKLDYSEGHAPLEDTRFFVETITGGLPLLGEKVKVFEIRKPTATFGVFEKAVENAKRAGFNEVPISTTNEAVKFIDPKDSSRILTLGTIDGTVLLESDYLINPTIIVSRVQSLEKAQKTVDQFFGKLNSPLTLFGEDSVSVENFKIENGILEESLSLSTTNLVRITFNKSDIDEISVINPDSENPLVWGLASDNTVVSAQFINGDVQNHRFSTYPLRSVELALEDLRQGNGALNKKPESNTFPIRNVELAYLETKASQQFLQPVYVFESDGGIAAYTSAVSDIFVKKD